MKHIVFLGLSVLGLGLIVGNNIFWVESLWTAINYMVISIFAANAIMFSRTGSRFGTGKAAVFTGICSLGAGLQTSGIIIDSLQYWLVENIIIVCLFGASIWANAYLHKKA